LGSVEIETNGGVNAAIGTKDDIDVLIGSGGVNIDDDTAEDELDRYADTSKFSMAVEVTQ